MDPARASPAGVPPGQNPVTCGYVDNRRGNPLRIVRDSLTIRARFSVESSWKTSVPAVTGVHGGDAFSVSGDQFLPLDFGVPGTGFGSVGT